MAVAVSVVFGGANAAARQAQATAAAKPQFDVASVKPCDNHSAPQGRGGGGSDSSSGATSPSARLSINCQTVKGFITMAYVLSANGQRQGAESLKLLPVEGGPDWINSERYTINAESEASASDAMMRGPMLQSLLEDRFKLKLHHETREIPIYEMTVAKSGFKLKPAEEGSCTPRDPANPRRQLAPGEKPLCGQGFMRRNGSDWTVDLRSLTMDEFCKWLDFGVDRLVSDKTGIAGKYDFHLEFSADEATPGFLLGGNESNDAGPPAFPAMFTMVQQQFGLKLVPAKGPGQFLVIDSVERPSGN
ncbi:MAG: TIGR03435 family protein [Candidatus Acidiferrales bacterium]